MSPIEVTRLTTNGSIQPRSPGCRVPLTPVQRHFLGFSTNSTRKPAGQRMCASAVRISGRLSLDGLRMSLDVMTRRHESLRTRIISIDGIPEQRIQAPGDSGLLETIDLSTLSPSEAEREVSRDAHEFLNQKIDLATGPLFDVRLWRLGEDHHVLVIALDHAIGDGVSNGILNREIWTLYNQVEQGLATSLPSLPVQFADYAVWLQRTEAAWKEEHEAYWKTRLSGVLHTRLPIDFATPAAAGTINVTTHISVGRAITKRLHEMAKQQQQPLSLVALTVYVLVMSQWCSTNDLVLSFVSHGRHGRPELENVIGLLVALNYLRLSIEHGDTILDLLQKVRREYDAAMEHQDYNRVLDFIPGSITDLQFHWRSTNWERKNQNVPLNINNPVNTRPFLLRQPNWHSAFWLLFFDTKAAGICATVHYRPDIFPPKAIEIFQRDFRAVSEAIVERPSMLVHSVSLELPK